MFVSSPNVRLLSDSTSDSIRSSSAPLFLDVFGLMALSHSVSHPRHPTPSASCEAEEARGPAVARGGAHHRAGADVTRQFSHRVLRHRDPERAPVTPVPIPDIVQQQWRRRPPWFLFGFLRAPEWCPHARSLRLEFFITQCNAVAGGEPTVCLASVIC
jgi:hypothetical protein